MASIIRLNRILSVRNGLLNTKAVRLISTSQKNRETATINPQSATDEVAAAAATKTQAKDKNWQSYGFDFKDKAADRNAMKSTFFVTVTLSLVWGTFIWSYLPDNLQFDWAQRQGYLVLRQREAAGLEPISRDYIDVSQIELPSDEELGKTEIII